MNIRTTLICLLLPAFLANPVPLSAGPVDIGVAGVVGINYYTGALRLHNRLIRGSGWRVSYSATVGEEESDQASNLKIFPNPGQGMLTLILPADQENPIQSEVYSFSGVKVYQGSPAPSDGKLETHLDLSDLPKGIYLLRLLMNSTVITKKIILN
jgi:hypothetical protein